jgi:putative hydrolase of the HAD superfamily
LSAVVDWAAIDTVFLDMDGTLLDLYFDNHFWRVHVPRRYAEIHGLNPAHAEAHLNAHYQRHHGTLAWYCLDFWSRELALDIVALKREVEHLIALRPDTLAFLACLRESGRRVVMVTNAHPASVDLKMQKTGIAALFDAIVSSHSLGLPKEHSEFWNRLAGVDDSLPVLKSARSHGIAHLLAIRNPDSSLPPTHCEDFVSIANFAETHPVLPARRQIY